MNKEFSYIDNYTGDYVKTKCSIKKEIQEADIINFCNKLYTLKLEGTYSSTNLFSKNHNTSDLKRYFIEMFSSEELNFEGLYDLCDSERGDDPRIRALLENFMSMFDFSEEDRYNKETLTDLARKENSKLSSTYNRKLKQTLKKISFNTKVVTLIGHEFLERKEEKKLIYA